MACPNCQSVDVVPPGEDGVSFCPACKATWSEQEILMPAPVEYKIITTGKESLMDFNWPTQFEMTPVVGDSILALDGKTKAFVVEILHGTLDPKKPAGPIIRIDKWHGKLYAFNLEGDAG